MKNIFIALISASALLATSSAFAYSTKDCGCSSPPSHYKTKSNSGIGNGSEGGPTEANDRDPGNSGANDNAGSNVGKSSSPRSTSVIP